MLKILIDEDLRGTDWDPIIDRLKADNHDIVSVFDESHGMRGLDDHEVGKVATEQQRLIVTRDKSFQRDNFAHDQSLPFGLLLTRLNHLSPQARAERVSAFIKAEGETLHNHSTVLEAGAERMKPMEQAYQEYQENRLEESMDHNEQTDIVQGQTPKV